MKKSSHSSLNLLVSVVVVFVTIWAFVTFGGKNSRKESVPPPQGRPEARKLPDDHAGAVGSVSPEVSGGSVFKPLPIYEEGTRPDGGVPFGDPATGNDQAKYSIQVPPDLPDDLKRQLQAPPPELPPDLKAQLTSSPPPIPDDIRKALATPPRTVSIDEVNKLPEPLEPEQREPVHQTE